MPILHVHSRGLQHLFLGSAESSVGGLTFRQSEGQTLDVDFIVVDSGTNFRASCRGGSYFARTAIKTLSSTF